MDLRTHGSRAVVIGPSTYDSGGLADVPAVTDTASALRQALIDPCGMTRESIRFLADPADAREVGSVLVTEAMRTQGVLVVYYVGHGLVGDGGELYLAVGGTNPDPGRVEQTAISYDLIRRQLTRQCPAQAMVFILDCCFAGLARVPDGVVDRGLAMLAGPEGGVLITSAAREEHALAAAGERYTAFTGALLSLLHDGDPDGPAELTLRHAYRYLRQKLSDGGLPRPGLMSAGPADDIVLAPNRAHQRPAADDDPTTVRRRTISPADLGRPAAGQAPAGQAPAALGSPAADSMATVTMTAGGTGTSGMATVTMAASGSGTSGAGARAGLGGSGAGAGAGPGGSGAGTSRGGGRPGRTRRPGLAWLAGAAAALLVVAGLVTYLEWPQHAGSGAPPAASGQRSASPGRPPAVHPTGRPTPKPFKVACAAGSLTLIGSTAFAPIAQEAADYYRHECQPDKIAITVTGIDSAYGLSQARGAQSASDTTIAMYDGTSANASGLRPHPLGVLVFSVVAHAGLFPGADVSLAELKEIFGQPGGEPGYVRVGRQKGSGSRKALFVSELGSAEPTWTDGSGCPPPPGALSCTEVSTGNVLTFVNATPDAIGYAQLSGYSQIYGSLVGYPDVAMLSIGNVAPTKANVLNGSYEYRTVEHLYVPSHPSELASDFLESLQHYLATTPMSGFIPCSSATRRLEADCS